MRLDQAQGMLHGNSLGGVWPRCAVWLVRLALEHALDALWERSRPELAECTRRSQLLALGVVVDIHIQQRTTELWNTLSRAAHHHHYELAPTVFELRGWLDDARTICSRLTDAT
jgi:hypothetical protein